MCLGVPGRIEELRDDELGMGMGRVSFGGIVKDVCLASLPEAQVGDYVLVHVGFGLSVIDEEEARRTTETLATMGELAELRASDGGTPPGRPA